MAGRRSPVTDIREILRRLQLGEPDRRIARDLSVSRNTVAHYRRWATAARAADGARCPSRRPWPRCCAAPPAERPAQEQSLVEPLREQVLACTSTASRARRSGSSWWSSTASGAATRRSSGSCAAWRPRRRRATLRLEVDPGDEAQVDFGFAGQFLDPEQRPAPARLGVRHDAVLQPASVRRARLRPERGDLAAPASRRLRVLRRRPPPRRARQSPGRDRPRRALRSRGAAQLPRVRRALRLSHRALPPAHARAQGQGRAGRRPLRQAQRPGRPRLSRPPRRQSPSAPLVCRDRRPPRARHDQADPPGGLRPGRARRRCSRCRADAVGADRVEAGQAPPRLPRRLRRRLLLGAPPPHRPAAVGARHRPARSSSSTTTRSSPPIGARRPGQRRTLTAHLPPDKVHFLMQTPTWCRDARRRDRPRLCRRSSSTLLGDRPLDRLRSAQGVLRLGQRYSAARLDAACARAARRRRVSLPHDQDDPGPRPRSASPCPTLTPAARRARRPSRRATPAPGPPSSPTPVPKREVRRWN